MKSFVVGLVFVSTLGLALAASFQTEVLNKTLKAVQECNATNPVHRLPSAVINLAILAGERVDITQEEKCFLLCFSQKVNFLDENGNIKNGPGLVSYVIHGVPTLGKNVDQLIASIWQIKRLYKGIEDKCHKAFVVYHEFTNSVFIPTIADALEKETGVKEKLVHSIETGEPFDQETSNKIKKYLDNFNTALAAVSKALEKELEKGVEKLSQAQQPQ